MDEDAVKPSWYVVEFLWSKIKSNQFTLGFPLISKVITGAQQSYQGLNHAKRMELLDH